jgi:CRP/FNR family transcriptional regulator, cyclic AMP receptor protein
MMPYLYSFPEINATMPRPPVRTSIMPSPRGPSVKIEQLLDSTGASKKTADFQKNQIIFSEGDAADTVLYLRKGLVRLSVTSHKGKEAIVEMLHPGDFFGTWCLAEHPFRMATATAMEPTTVRIISTNEMHRVLSTKNGLSTSFILTLLEKNIRIGQDLANVLLNSTERRLARKLLLLGLYGKQNKTGITLPEGVTQQMLAEMIGTTRTRVNFFMNRFKRLGLIEYDGGLKIRHSLSRFALDD